MLSLDLLPWIGFHLFVAGMLALDLGVLHRKARVMSMREAAAWSAVWVALALAFTAGVFYFRGRDTGFEFLTGYLIEKSLSVDNVFVFALIFSHFALPAVYQRPVLFWGVLGALLMRGLLILAGASLIKEFHWVIYLFGALLVVTGIRMALSNGHHVRPDGNLAVRLLRRVMPVTEGYRGHRFLLWQDGRLLATPLLVVLLVVETTDLVFAVDSIPAIFAITDDPFIVYTSNVFAILGLRSLYFLLAGIMDRFTYLKLGLSAVLVFVGTKMVVADFYQIPITISLGVIAVILAVAIIASLRRTPLAPETPELKPITIDTQAEV